MTPEQVRAFLDAVAEMRKSQREYFRAKNLAVLQQSKALEKQVDEMLAELKDAQKGLF
jgi:hypothetical protein